MSDTLSTDIHDVNPNFSYVQPHSFLPQRLAPMVAGNGNVVTMTGWGDEQGNQQVSMKFLLTPETQESWRRPLYKSDKYTTAALAALNPGISGDSGLTGAVHHPTAQRSLHSL
jgi:hypothetical protein